MPKVEDFIGKPLSPYAITKYVNELYADIFSKTYGLETIGLRYFNVFGRRQDPNGAYAAVIPKFIKLMKSGIRPTINGDGSYSRDFTYIDDIVEGIVRLIPKPPTNMENWSAESPCPSFSSCPYQVFNIGNNNPVVLNDFISILEDCIGKKAKKNFLPMQPGDVLETYADIDDLNRFIGFKPNTSIEEGILNFVNWYKDYFNVKI